MAVFVFWSIQKAVGEVAKAAIFVDGKRNEVDTFLIDFLDDFLVVGVTGAADEFRASTAMVCNMGLFGKVRERCIWWKYVKGGGRGGNGHIDGHVGVLMG
jgi:hypothetical protein